MKGMWLSLLWLSLLSWTSARVDHLLREKYIDAIVVVGEKDMPIVRYCLRHMVRYVKHLHTAYVVAADTTQAKSVVAQVNEFTSRETSNSKDENSTHRPRVVFFDEARFPVSIADIRNASLQRGWDGNHCCRNGKQEYRLGWYLQQFLKLYAVEVIPDIRDYLVVDADVIFFSTFDVVRAQEGYIYTPGKGPSGCSSDYKETLHRILGGGKRTGIVPKNLTDLNTIVLKMKRGLDRRPCGIAHHMLFKREVLSSLLNTLQRLAAWHGGEDYAWWRYIVDMIDTSRVSSFSEYVLYFTFAREIFPSSFVLRNLVFNAGKPNGGNKVDWSIFYFSDSNGRGQASAVTRCFFNGDLSRLKSTGDNFCTKISPKKCSEWRPNEVLPEYPEKCPFPVYTAFHRYKIEGGSEERRWMAAANFFEKEDKIWWEYHSSEASFR